MRRNETPLRWASLIIIATTVAALQGCGGGGGSNAGGCSVIDPSRDPNLPGCPGSGTGNPSTAALTLALTDAAGNSSSTVTPLSQGTLAVTVKDASGNTVPDTAVTFVTSDKTGGFVPASGAALSDARGVARIGLPAGTQAGAFTVTASATVGGKAVTGIFNYAVAFPQLTLSAPAIAPATLAAGGTASLSVTVMNGASVFTPAQVVNFSSPCVSAGKASISTPVTTVNGVASTSYTDKGCGGKDLITISTVYNGTTVSGSDELTVQPASAGQLSFVSALPQNIALRGTGGAGRQESSTVSFKVLDRNGNPVSGHAVSFALNTSVGGLSLNPLSSTTGANGIVTTTVASGTVNTPVRVTATLAGGALSTLSDQLVVSTGVPEQNSFSLSSSILNVEGGDYNGCAAPAGSIITARLADHFHNPAPDGTAVSFTAEGGSIDASCLTGLTSTTLVDGSVITQKGTPGECTVRFCAGNPKPADGRVTILAYALGEESFVDVNGNNVFDSGEGFTDLGEPFRNDRAVSQQNANGVDDVWQSGNGARASGEQYIDSNGDGGWAQSGDGAYNGVLKAAGAVNTTPANTVHVRQSLVQVLSRSSAAVTLVSGPIVLSHCVNGVAFVNQSQTIQLAIRDSNPTRFGSNTLAGNPLPAATSVLLSTSNGAILGAVAFQIGNSNSPDQSSWTFGVELASDAIQTASLVCTNPLSSGTLTVKVTTPNGNVTSVPIPVTD